MYKISIIQNSLSFHQKSVVSVWCLFYWEWTSIIQKPLIFGKSGQKLSKNACQQILYVACLYLATSIIQKTLSFQNILATYGSFWRSERYRISWYLTSIVSVFCMMPYQTIISWQYTENTDIWQCLKIIKSEAHQSNLVKWAPL